MVRGQVMVNGSLKPYEYIEYPKWINGKLIKEAPPELILKPEPKKNGNTSQKVNK